MRLVKNSPKYWEFIRNLRNNPDVKRGFIEQGNISEDEQVEYMSTYNNNYYICLRGKEPVGYIGQINMDIRLAVSPEYQGRGVGKFMLTEFMKAHPGAYGKVLLDNEPSRRLFESCGFKEVYRNDKFYYFIKR